MKQEKREYSSPQLKFLTRLSWSPKIAWIFTDLPGCESFQKNFTEAVLSSKGFGKMCHVNPIANRMNKNKKSKLKSHKFVTERYLKIEIYKNKEGFSFVVIFSS